MEQTGENSSRKQISISLLMLYIISGGIMEYMEQKMDELIEAGLHIEAEMKPKTGQYVFEIKIPVTVLYSKRDDNTVSIDSVSVPIEDDIYLIVDKHAKAIKAGAEVRATDAADGNGRCS
jgi:hypothetical protein